MLKTIEALRTEFLSDLSQAKTSADIEVLKVKFLGKKGPVQQLMKDLKDLSINERPQLGRFINDLKEEFLSRCSVHLDRLVKSEEEAQLAKEKIDITLPGRRRFPGRKHLLTHVMDQMIDILIGMGFSVQYGPEIDTDYYNFEALNFAPDHPARDMQDTFYIAPNILLRTHTSNIQARVMELHKPPIRIIAPGKVYRNETVTARSHVFFHQIETLYINRGVTFSDLISTMNEFLSKAFYPNIETRFRPSYFPFVEPGMEVDISCLVCEGQGCSICKHTGWLEIAGAGMVHPEVLKNSGIDPEVYTGFAWGMGLERMVMLKHGIKDIRLFTENDLRFLNQFSAI